MANVAPFEIVLNSQFLLAGPFQTLVSLTAQTKSLEFWDDIEVTLSFEMLAEKPAETALATLLAQVSQSAVVILEASSYMSIDEFTSPFWESWYLPFAPRATVIPVIIYIFHPPPTPRTFVPLILSI
jgi:hypothetical protein